MPLETRTALSQNRSPVSRVDLAPVALVEELKRLYPRLEGRPGPLCFLLHLLLTETVEPPGRTAPCPYALLGEIAGARDDQVAHGNFRAEPFLDAVRASVGERTDAPLGLVVDEPDHYVHLARRVRLDGVPPAVDKLAEWARSTIKLSPGEWVEVRPDGTFVLNATASARRRQQLMDSLPTYENTPDLSVRLQGYLNGLHSRSFSALRAASGDDETVALVDALYGGDVSARDRVAATLRSIQLCPVPVYGPSPSTPRIHARGRNVTGLPSAIRQAITERLGWVELDLAHAQLACNARRWKVRAALTELGRGDYDFWDDLVGHLGADPDGLRASGGYKTFKAALKPAVHGLSFGMGHKRIARFGVDVEETPDPVLVGVVERSCGLPFEEAGRRLLRHPILKAMLGKRYWLGERIKREGGWTDMFGRSLPLEEKGNPGRLLAIDTQAMELQLLEPVIEAAIQERERADEEPGYHPAFLVMLWQHDGFTVKPRDRQRTCTVVRDLRAAVAEQARSMRIPTGLTVDVGPDC